MRLPCSLRSAALAALCLASGLTSLRGQGSSPGPNLFGDTGGFEKIAGTEDNLWDGVNSENTLAVPAFSAQVLTERSGFAPLAMPPSVAAADLNGDGKVDLLVAAPNGYFYFYANSGTPTEPRFTNAEIVPIFLSTTYKPRQRFFDRNTWDTVRFCPRISLAPWRGRGIPDLMVGNYLGELFLLPNEGGAQRAAFRQPATLESVRIPTDDRGRLWGNLLSPAACDWAGNGKLALLLGEGTYSANVVRLMENTGGGTPKFSNTKETYLAYGDGREQLIPAVADFNGDGKPDLLVSDRTREIGLYLNSAEKTNGDIPRSATLSFGGTSKLPGFVAPCVADMNGDGLFDIVMGLDTGHLAVSYNTGSKGQPAFGPLKELKGQDRLGRNFKRPAGWIFDVRTAYGNAMAYFSVVNAQDDPASAPPEGANCLKAGYWPTANEVFPIGQEGIPGAERRFALVRQHVTLEAGKNYTLTFKVKNTGMEKLHYGFHSHFDDYIGAVKQEVDDRNHKRRVGERVVETVEVGGDFNAGGTWSTQTKTLNVRYKNPSLQSFKEITGDIDVEFWSRNSTDVLYLDDFALTPAKG